MNVNEGDGRASRPTYRIVPFAFGGHRTGSGPPEWIPYGRVMDTLIRAYGRYLINTIKIVFRNNEIEIFLKISDRYTYTVIYNEDDEYYCSAYWSCTQSTETRQESGNLNFSEAAAQDMNRLLRHRGITIKHFILDTASVTNSYSKREKTAFLYSLDFPSPYGIIVQNVAFNCSSAPEDMLFIIKKMHPIQIKTTKIFGDTIEGLEFHSFLYETAVEHTPLLEIEKMDGKDLVRLGRYTFFRKYEVILPPFWPSANGKQTIKVGLVDRVEPFDIVLMAKTFLKYHKDRHVTISVNVKEPIDTSATEKEFLQLSNIVMKGTDPPSTYTYTFLSKPDQTNQVNVMFNEHKIIVTFEPPGENWMVEEYPELPELPPSNDPEPMVFDMEL